MKTFIVPFKFFAEVKVDDTLLMGEVAEKHKAISLGIEHFTQELEEMLKEGSLLDIAHTFAPTMLTDVREV